MPASRPSRHLTLGLIVLLTGLLLPAYAAPALLEPLGRGLVALRVSQTDTIVTWRVLGTDPSEVAFNLYRTTGAGAPERLNEAPLAGPTHFTDSSNPFTQPTTYSLRPILAGVEQPASASFSLEAAAPVRDHLRVPLQRPPPGVTPAGESYTYSPNDASVGDLDGDGEYELVLKWEPSNAKDNSQSGYTGNVLLDGYKLDGTRLWRIDLGVNVRAGAHYTQFIVYDLDGDGVAEIACRTAPGSRDGLNTFVADPAKFSGPRPAVDHAADLRNTSGYIVGGPEFLTIFDGRDGAELVSTYYEPPRHPDTLYPTSAQLDAIWGDGYGNRIDRFNAAVAYLDGQRPSLIMARGYYTRAAVAAYDYRNGVLSPRWLFDTNPGGGAAGEWGAWRGQGNHQVSVADVDGDGRDEVIYGAAAIDDDGRGLYATGWGHGDALHVSKMDPDRPGLQVVQPHEDARAYGPNAVSYRDAATGGLIFGVAGSGDIGRGVAFDVDPRYRGYELWASGNTGGMYSVQQSVPDPVRGPRGVPIAATKPSVNFGIWWDGDWLRELLDHTTVSKWEWASASVATLLSPTGVASNNGTKGTPTLSGDILGDWREEVIWRETSNEALRIYVTPHPTEHRLFTLMHDRQYRLAIAWQNSAYNQPPHPSFFLGHEMAPPPRPDIVTSLEALDPSPGDPGDSDDQPPPTGARLANLSARARAGAGSQTLIAGFATVGGERAVLVRGVGPTLRSQGVNDPLPDPELTLFRVGSGGTSAEVATNLDWGGSSAAAELFASVGAFELPADSLDAALHGPLAAGVYTAHVTDRGDRSGVALLEVYAGGSQQQPGRLVNLSARAAVGRDDDILIAGFYLAGSGRARLLIRGVGPGLLEHGVNGVLADPQLQLYRNGGLVASNDDWQSDRPTALAAAGTRVGAFPLRVGSKDAALLIDLEAGAYTAQVSGVGANTGVALVELYLVTE